MNKGTKTKPKKREAAVDPQLDDKEDSADEMASSETSSMADVTT